MVINNPHFFCLFSLQLIIAVVTYSDSLSNIAFGSILDNRNVTVLDYTGDVAIIQFQNGTTYNLNVPKYSECVAYLVMSEGIPRYLVEGPDQDELLTNNELGLAEAMNECIVVGVGVSTMEAARK
jgi:hypothetical protein